MKKFLLLLIAIPAIFLFLSHPLMAQNGGGRVNSVQLGALTGRVEWSTPPKVDLNDLFFLAPDISLGLEGTIRRFAGVGLLGDIGWAGDTVAVFDLTTRARKKR